MSLGYESYEDNRDFEQEGLTGEVKRYVTEKMEFPNLIVTISETSVVEEYKIQVLKNMFATSTTYNEELGQSYISIYFCQDGKLIKFGKIYSSQVKSFMTLFKENQIDGFYDKDTPLTGDYLYVLSE